ncbi:MAG TPA: M3 family metallopeptidase [Candidatus Angelobacter sp.]|nr:M3 family metallopeptidase [Candidatus Angelobacter sp.]
MPYDFTTVSPDSVRAETDAALREADRLVDGVAAAAGSPTFATTLGALELASAAVSGGYGRGAFLGQCHPDPAVRKAGIEAERRLSTWRVAVVFRRDLYLAIRAFASTSDAAGLEAEDARLLEHWLRDFRRAGHELDDAARAELERLRTRLVDIEVEFGRTLNEYRDWIEVTREELDGLPDEYVARLDPGERGGTYRVTLDYPQLNPYLEQAHARDRRRELFMKHWNRAVAHNRPLLEEAIGIRHRLAELLGHATWADFAMEVKMARRPDTVRAFYRDLLPRLSSQVREELDALAEQMHGRGQDGPVTAWDWRYEHEAKRRAMFGLDQNAIAEYFPLDAVLGGMFALTGEVLGLEYRQVADARAWHPDVTLHEIRDRETGEVLAWFYADWHPRPGKFGHAAAFPLVVGHRGADGARVAPVSAILANFTPPGADRPALLKHGEVETLFHEFGHILHMSLSQAAHARFSAAETEWDFTEAPSQIMEHWTWEPEILRRFARHWQTGEPIPAELVERMREARWLNVGLSIGMQAFYGQVDLAIHGEPGAADDLDETLRRAYAVTGMPYPEGTFMLAGFGHLLGGYDAGYYGYLWAEVIGDDMFGRFAREGVASPSVGADYRREILEPNGTRDAQELVRSFLGRDFSSDEFLRLRGMA